MVRAHAPESTGVVIDVGAAGGGNTRVLSQMGFFAVPVEYGDAGVRVAAARNLPAVRGDARRLPFRSGAARVVVAFDLLEHVDDDNAAVAEMYRVIAPGGLLLLAVPSDMDLWSSHDEAVGHHRRYERESFSTLVGSNGFCVESIRSWNVLLRPVVARAAPEHRQ